MKPFFRKMAAVFAAMLAGSFVSFGAPDAEDTAPSAAPILTTELSGGDLAFLTEAASRIGSLVNLADMAGKRAVTPEIRAEAATVSSEQSGVAAKLKALAARLHVSLPDDSDTQGKIALQKLEKLKGVKFDKFFLDSQADAQDCLETTLKTATASTNGEIKSFAGNTLDTVKQEKARIRMLGM